MTQPIHSTDRASSFAGLAGAARRDVTPPPGIYARNWGAAEADTATGVHRRLTATALAFQSPSSPDPLLLIALDHGFWQTADDEWHVRGALVEELALPRANVLVCLSHTHSGPSASHRDVGRPGGSFVTSYRDDLREAVLEAGREALGVLEPAIVDWASGWSDLARNRDLDVGDRFLCGYAPDGPADGTLLVGRVTASSGRLLATVVNYACHPTTLAWENRLLSPDWVGAMRETVEQEVGGLCAFVQGASGELAPREQHGSSVERADEQGRQLGLGVLAVIAGMLPPGVGLAFDGAVESGAPLAFWRREHFAPSAALAAVNEEVALERADLPSLETLHQRWEHIGQRAAAERLERAKWQRSSLGDARTLTLPFWVWRLGDALFVAHPGEAYSWLQQYLRKRLPAGVVALANLSNGVSIGYLPPADLYDRDLYQVWQSPFAGGSLEVLASAVIASAERL